MSGNLFYEGSLEAGIAHALQTHKLVVCFVTDSQEQSNTWETEYLTEPEVAARLRSTAVTLRIPSGSREATFLSAFCPFPQIPAVVVINNGKLAAHLQAGLQAEDFQTALLDALPMDGDSTTSPTGLPVVEEVSSTANTTTDTVQARDPRVEQVMEERRQKLEADKKAKETAAKLERQQQAAAIRADKEKQKSGSSAPSSSQDTYAQQQRRKQQEATKERERILRIIENDKQERRYREDLRKEMAKAAAAGSEYEPEAFSVESVEKAQILSTVKAMAECAIQVRTYDGSIIRNKFSSSNTLRTHVRNWIAAERRDGDRPYHFRQILAPQQNRQLSISEEEESLQHLGLTPSATLVMVPIEGYTEAYSNTGILSKGFALGYNLVASGIGTVNYAIGSLLGHDSTPADPDAATSNVNTQDAANDSVSAGNIQTLHSTREHQGPHQLYNGNQLNFEPRPEDEGVE